MEFICIKCGNFFASTIVDNFVCMTCLYKQRNELKAACEVARHWLIVNDWLKLDETIAQLDAAIAEAT